MSIMSTQDDLYTKVYYYSLVDFYQVYQFTLYVTVYTQLRLYPNIEYLHTSNLHKLTRETSLILVRLWVIVVVPATVSLFFRFAARDLTLAADHAVSLIGTTRRHASFRCSKRCVAILTCQTSTSWSLATTSHA